MDDNIKKFLINFSSYFANSDFFGDLIKITNKEDFEKYLLNEQLVIQKNQESSDAKEFLLLHFNDLYKYIDKQNNIIYVNFLFWLDKQFISFSETDHHIVRLYFPNNLNNKIQKNIVKQHKLTMSDDYVREKKSLTYWLYRDNGPREYTSKPLVCIDINNNKNSTDFDNGSEEFSHVKIIINNKVVYPDDNHFPTTWYDKNIDKEKKAFEEYINWLTLIYNEPFFYYAIPAVFPYKEGFFGFYVASKSQLSEDQIANLKIASNYIGSVFQFIISKLISYAALKASTKSAIAAIMSRNMSHNLGSHVLSYLKSSIRDVPQALKNKLVELTEINNGKEYELQLPQEWYNKVKKVAEKIDNIEAPFLLGISRFIAYLQERQDFIATISTDYIPNFSSVNFKEFIYDEFNWDYKIARHKKLKRYNAKNILLDNIARSENINREKLHIFFHDFNGIEIGHKDLKYLRTINVDLPGGILGRQAFFSILENIIRNAAKHGNNTQSAKTSFVLTKYSYETLINLKLDPRLINKLEKIRDRAYCNEQIFKTKVREILDGYFPESYFETIFETIKESADYALIITIRVKHYQGKKYSEYWEIQITDNNGNGNESIKKVIDALHEPYLDNSGKLLESNKGIKEMRISAAWLQGRDITTIIKDENSLENGLTPVIQVCREKSNGRMIHNYKNKDGKKIFNEYNEYQTNLQYKFYLRKPQKFAYIIENPGQIKAINKNGKLVDININNEFEILTFEQFSKLGNKNFNLIAVSSDNDHLEDIKAVAPVRILKYNIDNLNADLQIIKELNEPSGANLMRELNKIYLKLYEIWLKKQIQVKPIPKDLLVQELPRIVICDDLARNKVEDNERISITSENKITNQSIIYRKHNDTIREFLSFRDHKCAAVKNAYNQALFIEGITGRNSTSRLIRNEKLDKYWALKMIESALTSVCIIDERIWERIDKGEKEGSLLQELYGKKNINVFNITKSMDTFLITDTTKQKIGEIKLKDGNPDTQLEDLNKLVLYKKLYSEKTRVMKYDFVLIHQGILDKLYDFFNKDIQNKNEEITMQTVFDNLQSIIKAKYRYVVHSGRSKPDKIPNGVSFILFSTLLKVFDDSKYSLCQLLYSSCLINQ